MRRSLLAIVLLAISASALPSGLPPAERGGMGIGAGSSGEPTTDLSLGLGASSSTVPARPAQLGRAGQAAPRDPRLDLSLGDIYERHSHLRGPDIAPSTLRPYPAGFAPVRLRAPPVAASPPTVPPLEVYQLKHDLDDYLRSKVNMVPELRLYGYKTNIFSTKLFARQLFAL